MKRSILPFLGLLFVILVAGCMQTPIPKTEEIDSPVVSATGYPVVIFNYESAYPGYPISKDESAILNQGPDFAIDRPVFGGDYSLSGTGPIGVPIELIDVFMGGELLGKTTINDDGLFVFDLNKALVKGHSIGIKLGDISNTELLESDFMYNDTYFDVPLIGILFDVVSVE